MVAVIGVEPMTFRVWTERSSQLSYTAIFWCPEAESNHRHGDFQSPALPTELSGQMVGLAGLEPPAPWSQTMCATKLRYTSKSYLLSYTTLKSNFFQVLFIWQGWRDSNPRRTVLETDALPTELHPYEE